METHSSRYARAHQSLLGVQVGDALGERFFGYEHDVVPLIEARTLPAGPWRWTDDTLQAASVVEVLASHQALDQDALAASLSNRLEVDRGYGWATRELLHEMKFGASWRELAPMQFEGSGSYGNGSAMRIPPLGAYFRGDLDHAVQAARESSVVTHTHPEAVAGAIAVTAAAALATTAPPGCEPKSFLRDVIDQVPASAVRDGLKESVGMHSAMPSREVAGRIGSGQHISAADTVPFAVWCAATSLDDFEETFWRTVAGLGDRDTTCAMSCGIVAARVGPDGIPAKWLASVEPLPHWLPTPT